MVQLHGFFESLPLHHDYAFVKIANKYHITLAVTNSIYSKQTKRQVV